MYAIGSLRRNGMEYIPLLPTTIHRLRSLSEIEWYKDITNMLRKTDIVYIVRSLPVNFTEMSNSDRLNYAQLNAIEVYQ